MRIGKTKSIDREAAFNAYRKSMEDNSNDEEDEETANLVILQLSALIEAWIMTRMRHRKRRKTSSGMSMTRRANIEVFDEVKEPEISCKEEEEPEVNLEGELVAALEELTIETKKHKKTANKLEEAENLLLSAKGEMEEDKRIIEELEAQVVLKTEKCSKLKEQVTILHAQVDELSQKIKVYQGSSKLDNLLNMQRPCHIKLGLGYEHGETSTKLAEDKVKETQQKVVKQVPTQAHPQVKLYIHMIPSQRTWPRRQNFKPSRPLQQTYFRSKAYKCYNKRLQKIVESANVKIDESVELPKDVKEIELLIYENTSEGLEEQEEQPEQEKEVEANDNSNEMRQNDRWHKCYCFFFFITLLQLVFSVSCIVAASKLRHA
ncbi:hypothetical protein MRB53_021398 [Persea americana]|uniref:Uncharacterized protein n=1 Tax=Persea americana TaxID=3435 RepID=A0ACC2L3H6_PERAE|nr:hypothetical protein MRB53_021398 [Persea americana]